MRISSEMLYKRNVIYKEQGKGRGFTPEWGIYNALMTHQWIWSVIPGYWENA